MLFNWLTISGLCLDAMGFALISWELWTKGLPFWGPTPGQHRRHRAGFVMIILGFLLQAIGQGQSLIA